MCIFVQAHQYIHVNIQMKVRASEVHNSFFVAVGKLQPVHTMYIYIHSQLRYIYV